MDTSHPNIDFIKARIPIWMTYLSSAELGEVLPASATACEPQWLKSAPRQQRLDLENSQARSHASRHEAAKAFSALQSAYEFCKPQIENLLHSRGAQVEDILAGQFVERTAGFNLASRSLFEAAMKNFSSDELAGLAGDKTSILSKTDSKPAYPDRLPLSAVDFATACRELDLGKRYQQHLLEVLDEAPNQEQQRSKKKSALRDLMAVDANVARLKGDIDEQGYEMLTALLAQSANTPIRSPVMVRLAADHVFNNTRCTRLALYGVALTQVLILAPSVSGTASTVPCVVYLPGDPLHPLKQYPSLNAFQQDLIGRLASQDFRRFIARFATIKERPSFLDLLVDAQSLQHSQNWLQVPVRREIFDVLYNENIQFIKDESRALVVSTADSDDVDRGDLDSAYNTALAGSLFMPIMGVGFNVVLLSKWLSHFFHGADHWNVKVQETGQAFLRAVLLNARIADGEEEVPLTPDMARLVAVRLDDGREQLWLPDLLPYAQNVYWMNNLAPNNRNGIYDAEGRQWVRIDGAIYQVTKDTRLNKWRIVSPVHPNLFRPVLEHNEQGAWHHVMERPEQWERATLLRRLGYLTQRFSARERRLLGDISAVTNEELRTVYRDDQAIPGVLHETLIRLSVDRQIWAMLSRVREGQVLAQDYPHVAKVLVQLPNWPKGKELVLYDSVEFWGPPVQVNGTAEAGVEPVKVARADFQGTRLLDRVLAAIAPQRQRRDVNDDQDEPRASLCRALAEGLERVLNRLFEHFYQHAPLGHLQVTVDDEQALTTLRGFFPGLTRAVGAELLRTVDVRERARWQAGQQPSLALTERAVEVSRRVRLSRAFTDFELVYLGNEDTQVLALRLLEQWPGWPGQLRLELRDTSIQGRLIASIGEVSATNHRLLVRFDEGWQLYDGGGLRLGSFSNANHAFFAALHAALPALNTNAIDSPPATFEALRRGLRNLATADPERARQLLNIGSPPRWLRAELPVVARRRGYPLDSLIGGLFASRTPQQRLEAIFVDDTPTQIALRVQRLTGSQSQREQEVTALEQQFRAFSESLNAWVRGTRMEVIMQGHGSRYYVAAEQRRRVAHLLDAAWRFQVVEDRVIRLDSGGIELRLSGMALDSLPALSGQLASVEVLELNRLDIASIPDDFLRAFPNLQFLRIEGTPLRSVPAVFTELRSLEFLALVCPTLTPDDLEPLRGAPSLTALYLSFSPAQTTRWTARHMAALASIDSLRMLYIFHSQASFEAGAFADLGHLEELVLSGNQITLDENTAGLWQGLTRLQRLDLSGNPLVMAPHLQGMTGLSTLMLDRTQITGWPAGLESLAAITRASLLDNRIAGVPVGAGRVTGLRVSLSLLPPAERAQVETDMIAVGNPDRFVETSLDNPAIDLFEGGSPIQRVNWGIVREAPTAGMGQLFESLVLVSQTEAARRHRAEFLQQVQQLFDAMSEQQAFLQAMCQGVLIMLDQGRDNLHIAEQLFQTAQMYRVVQGGGDARAVLIAQARSRGRWHALARYVDDHVHEWRMPGRVVEVTALLAELEFRLAQSLPMSAPLLRRTPHVALAWVDEAMVQAAEQAVSRSEARDLVDWLLDASYWFDYLRATYAPQFAQLRAQGQQARAYLNALANARPLPQNLSDEVTRLLAGAMQVEPLAVTMQAHDPARMPDWRRRLHRLLVQWEDALAESLTREAIVPAPPA